MVVTDMLAAYSQVIAEVFPNAQHQYCVFHFIQILNKFFKEALKKHRIMHFPQGERKAAHKISFLLLKGQEKLSTEEHKEVALFIEKHPTVAQDYAMKEDFRTLYADAKTPEQAYAYFHIIMDLYQNTASQTMQKALLFAESHFDKTITYLKLKFFMDKTNNDAERMMRTIKRSQQTHYFFRKQENYIKKLRAIFATHKPRAA